MTRVLRGVVILATAAAALLLPAGANAAGTSSWSVDLLVAYHAGPGDSAALAWWSTAGSVTQWELDVDPDSVSLQWVQADGNMGTWTYIAYVSDGQPHRIHVDARQVGPDIVATLTVSGFVVQPITVEGQQIGAMTRIVASPAQPLRHATFTADVQNVTGTTN